MSIPASWAVTKTSKPNGAFANITAIVNGERNVIAEVREMPCINGHDEMAAQRASDMKNDIARLIGLAPEMLALAKAIVSLESSPLQSDYVPPAIQTQARNIVAASKAWS